MAVPQHIAMIMDGNGRWARQRSLPRVAGHRAGTENIRRIVRECVDQRVRYLTLYAFSTENWNRPTLEVRGLMTIMAEFIVHSVPGSPFGRAVLAALEEKGADYRLAAVPPGGMKVAPHIGRHPFGRVPVLEHDDFSLYETQAILRYLDRVLPTACRFS